VNFVAARAVADAVMYEDRTFYRRLLGVVMSPGYAALDPAERSFAQTECVLEHGAQPTVAAIIRFLQVQRQTADDAGRDETIEHEIAIRVDFTRLAGEGHVTAFEIPGGADREGAVVRVRQPLAGAVSLAATPLPGPWGAARLRVRVDNLGAPDPVPRTRHEALPTALVATHMMIGVRGGAFVSMTDPPEWASAGVQACENVGCWPVLAGADGGRGQVLSTPVYLYDHPELAPAEKPSTGRR
jgi:hypothetical protein